MSKIIKVAVILAVAAVAIAAKQFASPSTDKAGLSMSAAPAISPSELMHRSKDLPELKIENLF